jgi:hypothetical protein
MIGTSRVVELKLYVAELGRRACRPLLGQR